MAYRTLGLALLCAAIAACGGDDDGGDGGSGADGGNGSDGGGGADAAPGGDGGGDAGTRGDASAGPFALHIIHNSCGPADGPAVRIELGESAAESCAVDELAPHVLLDVWTQDIVAPVIITFAPTEASGSGAFCPGGTAPCRSFPSGDIQFDAYTAGEGAQGSWRLLADEEMMTGDFNATWCETSTPPPCG